MKKWKNITKRIVALGLAAVLIANSVPVTALADSDTMSFDDLQTLIASAADGGTITLEKDVEWKNGDSGDSDPLVIRMGKTITLDLNGHTIDRGLKNGTAVANGNVITVSGNLTLTDSSTGKTGTITGGNNTLYGGGVSVNNGTFTMEGGSITDCSATGADANSSAYGGGVYVNNGTFTMEGGSITDCSATGTGAYPSAFGGGVYVNNGTFTMKGGGITNCSAISTGANGGGVYVNNGTFTMEGGSIINCSAFGYGGGVYVPDGKTLKVSGTPVISGNNHKASNNASPAVDNVFLSSGLTGKPPATVIVTAALGADASIGVRVGDSGNTVIARGTDNYDISTGDAEKFHNDNDTRTLVRDVDADKYVIRQVVPGSWSELRAKLLYGGNTVKLDRDYTAGDSDTALEVPFGKNVTLDLNDHYILYKGTGSAPVITVNGSLTLKDSKTTGRTTRYVTLTEGRATGVSDSGTVSDTCIEVTGGFIAGGSNENNNGGGVYVNDRCMFTMEGGTIAGCKAGNGGGVNVNNSGTFTMEGGTIVGCKALSDGGGVFINNTGNFNMNGGSIKNCTATGSGDKRGGGSVYVSSSGKFNMEGGSITDCTADSGGGVFVLSGNFNMNGGSITDCTATSQGGGVYVYGGTFKICGAPVIRDNKKGSDANNVALSSGRTITVTGELTTGAEIRVNASNGYTVAVPGTPSGSITAYTITAADVEKFHSDDTSLSPGLYGGNVVFKETLPTATLDNPSMVYDGSAFSPTISFEGATLTKDSDYTLSYKKVVNAQETALTGAPKDAGSYKLVIAGKGGYAGIQELEFTITQKPVTVVSGITAKDKEYDGGTTAELITTGAVFEGKCNGDTLTVSATGAGTFADKDAGASKAVSIDATKFVLGGASAGNYELADGGHQSTATGRISKKSITITEVTANDKEYDGNTAATTVISAATVTGLVGTDAVTFTVDGVFADANKGNNKTVTLSNWNLTSGGTNYEIDAAHSQKTTTASITGVQVYIAGVSVQNKTYDGNKSATVTGTAILKKVNGNDTVSGLTVSNITAEFEDKKAGNNKTVTITGGTLSDTDNYILVPATITGLTANITPASVTITGLSAKNKTYDGTTYATVTGTPVINGKIGNDAVTVSVGTAAFDNANVGNNKTVTFSGFGLSGTDSGNYSLFSQPTNVFASITAKPLAGTVTISGGSDAGIQVGDKLTATLTPANIPVSYQWLINGVASEGATSSEFRIPDGTAAGSKISVRVTGSGNYTGSLTSSTVEMGKKSVGDATVSIDETESVGETLTATVNVGNSGMTASDYSLVWCRDGANITGATLASYTIAGADRGHTITVKLIAKGNYSGEIVSNGKTIPAGTPEVSANATAGNAQATVTWTVDAAGQVINQYQVTCVETNEVIMLSPDVSSYTFAGLTNGTAYSFKVKAVYGSSSVESTAVSATPTAPSDPGGGTGGGSGGGSIPATSPAPSAAPGASPAPSAKPGESPAPSAAPGTSPAPSAAPGTSPAPTIVEQRTETTNNPDGTTTTTTTTVDSEGTKTTEAETVLTDGSVEKVTDVVKADGSTEKVVETEHPDGSSEKTVDIVKADGTAIHEDVKTSSKGTETSYRSETLPTGDKTVTEQVKQPSGDFSKTTTSTTVKTDDAGNIISTSVNINVEVNKGNTTTKSSFTVISSKPNANKNALGAAAKLAAKGKNQVALTKATTNAKSKTVTIPKTVKADGVTYSVVTLKKGMLKGNKKKLTKVKLRATGVTTVEKGAFKAMAKKGTIYVSGSKKQFKKLKKLIVKSGLPKGVKVKRAK